MQAVDNLVKRLRSQGRAVPASLLASWKSGVAFVGLGLIAGLYWNDSSALVAYGKVALASIALLAWFINGYFKRRHWELER